MQDIHPIGPGGGGGGGDRRLRTIAGAALSHHLTGGHFNGGSGGIHALKCPRCDSMNTKFCYYNNYNLSQPRHFCKSCRRYWTKGGVLRNVPVGGGCRKSKSKHSSKSSSVKQNSSISPPPPTDAAADPLPPAPPAASNSHSSSESSGPMEAVSGFNSLVFEGGPPMFPDLGSLSGLMTSPSSESALTSFGFNNNSLLLGHSQEQLQVNDQVWDHDDHHRKESAAVGGGLGFGQVDWPGTGGGDVPADQGLFDLPVINTVDQAYWSQSQWNIGDHDHPNNLYLP